MCGIVGLLLKKPELRERLGELAMPMLIGMTERGPDSAGLAVFTGELAGMQRKYSFCAPDWEYDWAGFESSFIAKFGGQVTILIKGNHAVLTCSAPAPKVRSWAKQAFPQLHVLAAGRLMDIYKDVGSPADVAGRYEFEKLAGSHLVAHTRMATESAVTPDRAHPFTAGEDFCLVHNGSLSNPYQIRRRLEPLGIGFDTDNDTEAACRYFEWRMREGDDLETAIHKGFEELDGFYTFLMGTADQLALVRDAFACKPAVVAETDDYVAISSEFRSLSKLPDIKNATIFEPAPEEIYLWRV